MDETSLISARGEDGGVSTSPPPPGEISRRIWKVGQMDRYDHHKCRNSIGHFLPIFVLLKRRSIWQHCWTASFAFSKTRPIETILGLFSELLSIQNVSLTMLTFSVIFKQRDFAMYWSSITLVKGRKSSWKSPHSEGGGDNSCHWSSLSNRCLIWCLDILMQGLQESNWWNTWAGQKLIMYHAHDPPSRLCTSSVTAVKALAGDFWGRQEVNHFLPSLGLRSASSGLLMTKWSSLRPA